MADLASDGQREIITIVNYVILCGFISFFGAISNVINMMIFYRQGLNTTINISFFAMAVSDLCSLLIQQLFNFYINPLCQDLDLPIVYSDVQHLTSGIPREAFARITCLITVYITAERCLCIAFPLHIKQMITPKRTVLVISLIYSLSLLSFVPLYATSYYDWKFYPNTNRTLLSLVFGRNSEPAIASVYIIHAMSGLLAFPAVVMFTLILVRKLGEKIAWRQSAIAHQDNSETMSQRDRTTVRMIVLIATVLIMCYTPAVFLCVITFIVPEFSVGGKLYNLYYISWSFALLFENINSSVNIFLYFKISSKYRQSFHELFGTCRQANKDIEHGIVNNN